jgi:hypothetical protein
LDCDHVFDTDSGGGVDRLGRRWLTGFTFENGFADTRRDAHMINLLIIAFGACAGALAAVSWFARSDAKWFVVASTSVVCSLMGAFLALPHPPQAVTGFIAFGMLTTAGTPLLLLRPFPDFRQFGDVWRVARQMAVWLTATTFYGAVFALVGYMIVGAVISMQGRPFYG